MVGNSETAGMKTESLYIARDGIFPIVRDADGHPFPDLPASEFDIPGTIQGEGKMNGIPSLFIRLAGCNLHCCWTNADGSVSPCDTLYASYKTEGAFFLSTAEICRIVEQNTGTSIHHLVITGGEPMLQAKGVTDLCIRLRENKPYHITVETNATIYNEEAARQIDFFSLSPKLSGSAPLSSDRVRHERLRLQPDVIQAFISHARSCRKDFQLKFVYSGEQDIREIRELLSGLKEWNNDDILLMPQGRTLPETEHNSRQALLHCLRNGWRYCDRLHLRLFGCREGV